ncbi:YDG domain-containing protein, partial [Chitinivibrio alkaliphilus]|uniref:YDG domain-containing protein n=1 Tax=Chitinivibrio alkaliphilus TaxID=1505232 RepID=UPI00054CDB02
GDDLEFSYDAAFEDENVGNDKDVNFTNIAISGGADADNYTLDSNTGTATANITARFLEITAESDSKEYDGTALTNAGYTVSDGSVVGTETLDAVTVTGSQTDVGTSDNV